MKMNYKEEMHQLNIAIQNAQKTNQNADHLYKRQLRLLEMAHDEFISTARQKGIEIENNPSVAEVEIQQYSAMKQIAQKLGIPSDKYDNMIHQIHVRLFGEEGAKEYFGEK